MKRLFIALHIIPEEEFEEAYELIEDQLSSERIKWVEKENLHLTLKFIGEVEEEMVLKIKEQLLLVESKGALSFSIEGVGLLKSLTDPRVIYAHIKNGERIEALSNEINHQLEGIGIEAETKRFLPHLTFGRIKFVKDKELLSDLLTDFRNTYFQKVNCKEFVLYESILTQKGPIYKKIKSYTV